MIDYSNTNETLKALCLMFPDIYIMDIKKSIKSYKRESDIVEFLRNLLPF
jgi:hypothetical protein